MKIFKTVITVTLLSLALCLPVCGEHLPEDNVIGSTVIVERDRNVVEDNLKGNHGFDPEDYTATVMTKPRFFLICTAPALIVAASGVIALAASKIKPFKKKNN